MAGKYEIKAYQVFGSLDFPAWGVTADDSLLNSSTMMPCVRVVRSTSNRYFLWGVGGHLVGAQTSDLLLNISNI